LISPYKIVIRLIISKAILYGWIELEYYLGIIELQLMLDYQSKDLLASKKLFNFDQIKYPISVNVVSKSKQQRGL
jgi:hypothetical protein